MNILALPLTLYDSNYLYCLDSKPNLIMNGNFTKINYTHPHFTMNGLFFFVPITPTFVEQSSENTNFVHFDGGSLSNKSTLECVVRIEHELLSKYAGLNNSSKTVSYSMTKQFMKGKLKINGDSVHSHTNSIVLKISGVWENEIEYGITFRWIYAKLIN